MSTLQERKLPVGLQSFRVAREEGCILVDKTDIIYRLVQKVTPFFLSRPRRFGKSLLLSTMKSYWEGRKDLFEGLAIERLEEGNPQAWKPYPVFYMDFDAENYGVEGGLEAKLNHMLKKWGEVYGVQQGDETVAGWFGLLLEAAYEQTGLGCVVLVDEYDKPLLDAMGNPSLMEHNREVLRGFFGNLKSCSDFIRFIFVTGITKFHKVSIFSDLNNLIDISLNKQFATICGLTQEEIDACYGEEIEDLAQEFKTSPEECVLALREKYDGYRFHQNGEKVYNPYSLLYAFFDKELSSYWYETGTPTFLVKRLKEIKFDIRKFTNGTLYGSRTLLSDYTDDVANPIPLLYQSGYLTIKDYDNRRSRYLLGFPNKEVEEGFLDNLMPTYVPSLQEGLGTDIYTLDVYIENGDLEGVRNVFTALFAGSTYTKADDPFENYFQTVLYLVFTLLNKFVQCEMHTYTGRIDCRVMTDNYVYLFEFKRDDTAENALAQIDDKDYALPFVADHRKLFKIGVGFDSAKRILKEWKVA